MNPYASVHNSPPVALVAPPRSIAPSGGALGRLEWSGVGAPGNLASGRYGTLGNPNEPTSTATEAALGLGAMAIGAVAVGGLLYLAFALAPAPTRRGRRY